MTMLPLDGVDTNAVKESKKALCSLDLTGSLHMSCDSFWFALV